MLGAAAVSEGVVLRAAAVYALRGENHGIGLKRANPLELRRLAPGRNVLLSLFGVSRGQGPIAEATAQSAPKLNHEDDNRRIGPEGCDCADFCAAENLW